MLVAVPLFAAGYRLLREDLARRTPAPVEEKVENIKDEQSSKEEVDED
jgi:hypothetical protein